MDLKDFTAGELRQQADFKAFVPSSINTTWTWTDPAINTLLADANRKLGELNAFSLQVPDVDYFIHMHVLKEATTSSKIEGTATAIEEAVLRKQEVVPERRDDWQEVQNYTQAMNEAVRSLKRLPVSTRLIKQTHKTLLGKGRGVTKTPGEFRRSQNWIGGNSPKDAVFVPPPHAEVHSLMADLEKFLHNADAQVPDLVRIAIAHYQFETIHPFLDGNGRVGRLLITLFLVSQGLLVRPTLYLSDYFDKHRAEYYDELTSVRLKHDLSRWVAFFLTAVLRTSDKGIETFRKIVSLRSKIDDRLLPQLGRRAAKGAELMKLLYHQPYVAVADVQTKLRVAPATANMLVKEFVRLKILEEVTGWRRNRRFIFREYVRLFAG